MAVRIEFLPGNATADMLQHVWTEVLAEITEPGSEARAEVQRLGGDPISGDDLSVIVEERSNDFGATFVVTIVAPLALHVLKGLFDDIVRPRIRQRYGVDVGDVRED
jgi:hypothetical protein